ncbi:MAG: hypothetical protein HKN16_13195, partial [Saprospiraceae bacterium]|nr:hypothetical protein [Saprospiraceae bacterium]
MKNIVFVYTTFVVTFFVLSLQGPALDKQDLFSPPPPCGPSAQIIDSLALVALHSSLNGPGWASTWNLNDPVCSWFGITLDANGFVREIILSSNFLWGPLPPDIGLFQELRILQLDNNIIFGTVPSQIGLLSNLEILFIDDNQISGSLPDEMGDLQKLQTIFMDNNFIEGTVPASMATISNLQRFELFNNWIDSLPDFSGVPNMQDNKFRFYNNRLTFDDILPNLTAAVGTYYQPQDSVCDSTQVTVATGTYYTFDLDFDDTIQDNSYQWFKDGLPFGAPLNVNQLTIGPIDYPDAGKYTCEVTNPGAPLLTLYCRPTILNVVCGATTNNMNDSLCTGQFVTVNGTLYNESNPSGTETLPIPNQYGCDSIVVVDLTFVPPPMTNFNPTYCPGETVTINGTVYSQGNPSGIETFEDAIGPGCDSVVNVNITYNPLPSGNYSPTLCNGDTAFVNGNPYYFLNPIGIEILDNASQSGCDSVVQIFLSFHSPAVGSFSGPLCESDTLMLNGNDYYQGNETGQEILEGASQFGCDSIVNISLTFLTETLVNYSPTLCDGGSELINGTVYNAGNPIGTEILTDQNGCDSTIQVSLSFFPANGSSYSPTLCAGEEQTINGTLYNASNPVGTEILTDQNGCDSTVNISLAFFPANGSSYTPTLCPGEEEIINGTTYNEASPTGTEILTDLNGCDSTVTISLSFFSDISTNYSPTLCPGEAETINGTLYNASNPIGTEILVASNGCDSTVNVSLSFHSPISTNYSNELCSGSSETINGTIYDEGNPTGSEIFTSQNGCDSTVNITLTFVGQIELTYDPTFCPGESELINGTLYNESNPTGSETLTAQSGCDSVVQVSLTFFSPISTNYSNSLCP